MNTTSQWLHYKILTETSSALAPKEWLLGSLKQAKVSEEVPKVWWRVSHKFFVVDKKQVEPKSENKKRVKKDKDAPKKPMSPFFCY